MPILPMPGSNRPEVGQLDVRSAGVPQSERGGNAYGAQKWLVAEQIGGVFQNIAQTFIGAGAKQQAIKDDFDLSKQVAGTSFQEENNKTIMEHPDASGAGLVPSLGEKFDKYADEQRKAFAAKGASPAAQRKYDIQLAEEKKRYLDNGAVTSTKMAAASGAREIDLGLRTILTDISVNGATSKEDWVVATSKGTKLISDTPGPDQNSKDASKDDFLNKAAILRFETLMYPKAGGMTKEGIIQLQKELDDPFWQKQLETTAQDKIRTSLAASRSAFAELTAEGQQSEHVNRVAGHPEEYEAQLANLLGVDTSGIDGVKLSVSQRNVVSDMTRARFEAFAEQAVTGGDELMTSGKAKTKEEAEAKITALQKDLTDNPIWGKRMTTDTFRSLQDALQSRKNALDKDWNELQRASASELDKRITLERADVAATATNFQARQKEGRIPPGEFKAWMDARLKLGDDNLTASQKYLVDDVYDTQVQLNELGDHPTKAKLDAAREKVDRGGTGTGEKHSPRPATAGRRGETETLDGKFTPHPSRGMMTLRKADPTADLSNVSAGLQDSIAAGATHLKGYHVEATEGYSATGHVKGSQHKRAGQGAIDLWIVEDSTGKRIPREGADTTGLYGKLAAYTREEMRRRHPELVRNFRWGGTFETYSGSGKADLMHFDLGGHGGGGGDRRIISRGGEGTGLDAWKAASAANETGTRANPYQVQSDLKAADGTYDWGKYQVNEKNIGPWTEKYFGKRLSVQEFINSPEAQEKVYEGEFGRLVKKYGVRGAAAAWNGGEGGMNGTRAQRYADRFMHNLGAGGGGDTSGDTATGNDRTSLLSAPRTPAQASALAAIASQEKALSDGLKNNTIEYGAQQIGASVINLDPAAPETFDKREGLYGKIGEYNGGLASDQQHPLTQTDVNVLSDMLNSNDSDKMNQVFAAMAHFSAETQEAAWKQLELTAPFGAAAGRVYASDRKDIANLAQRGHQGLVSLENNGVTPAWMQGSKDWWGGLGDVLRGITDPTKGVGMKQVVDAVHFARHKNEPFDGADYQKDYEDVMGVKLDTVNGGNVEIIPGTTGAEWEQALPALDLTALSLTQTPALAIDPIKLVTDPDNALQPVSPVAKENLIPVHYGDKQYMFFDTDGNLLQTITKEKTERYPKGKPQVYVAQLSAEIIHEAAARAYDQAITPEQSRTLKSYEQGGMGQPGGPDTNLGVTPPLPPPTTPQDPLAKGKRGFTSMEEPTQGGPTPLPPPAPVAPKVITPAREKAIQSDADDYIDVLKRNASITKEYLDQAREDFVRGARAYELGQSSQ